MAATLSAFRGPLDDLDQRGKIMAEHVWFGGAETSGGLDIRSKTMTLDFVPKSPDELRILNYDGSSTGQAPGENSEVLIRWQYYIVDGVFVFVFELLSFNLS